MRAEVDVAGAPRTARVTTTPPPPLRPAEPIRRRFGWFELAVFGVFAAVSLWVLALDLFQVVAHGRVWTGTDGVYVVDQMQYVAWIQSASHHLLSANLFVLHGTPADYLQPAVTISAGLTALGVAPWLTLLLWKPVAVLAAFFGFEAFVRRMVPGVWPRRAALVLALFFGSFTIVEGSFGVVGDLFAGFLSWGYTFGLLALGLMVFAMLAYDRARAGGPRRYAWAAALLGATAGSLHPWQGELLILIVLGAELAAWRGTRRRPALTLPAAMIAATAMPLVYYVLLGRVDQSWSLAREASKHAFSFWTIVLALAPLLIAAVPAFARRSRSFLETVTRVWPVAAVLIFVLSATELSATPLHAFEGITLPLAVLAVEGVQRAGFGRLPHRRLIGAVAVAAFTIPATYWELHSAESLVVPQAGNANFVIKGERDALRYLASNREPGGVLTRFYLGSVVPADTGRRTFVGDCLWSEPGCSWRAILAQQLLDGTIPAWQARQLVNEVGARFVLTDCTAPPDVARMLTPISSSVRRFGCAAVYRVSSPGPGDAALAESVSPGGPLAESRPNAALRASGRNQRRVQSS
jgi:hypothetical protein